MTRSLWRRDDAACAAACHRRVTMKYIGPYAIEGILRRKIHGARSPRRAIPAAARCLKRSRPRAMSLYSRARINFHSDAEPRCLLRCRNGPSPSRASAGRHRLHDQARAPAETLRSRATEQTLMPMPEACRQFSDSLPFHGASGVMSAASRRNQIAGHRSPTDYSRNHPCYPCPQHSRGLRKCCRAIP